jgi:tRNA threonylcarbamoyladenosine modification (KEOPS) complex  Pcc1 subunit
MEAAVRLLMGSPREAEIASKAISVAEKPGSRSSVSVSPNRDVLQIDVTATDLGALRAALNSTLREAKIASDSML